MDWQRWTTTIRRRRALGCLLVLATWCPGVAADPPTALARARVLSASPETPVFSLSYRGSLRGTLGGELPLVGARGSRPYTFEVVPLVELHNLPGSDVLLPNESWRGHLGAEVWRTFPRQALPWEVGVVVEHESDHDTGRGGAEDRFLGINDVGVRGLVELPLGSVALAVNADVRWLVWSCTRIATPCADFEGSTTLGAAAGVVADLRATASTGWHPFLATDLSGFVARGSVAAERRVTAQAGVWSGRRRSLWQVVVLGMAGNDVGLRRTTTVGQLGVGTRFAFLP